MGYHLGGRENQSLARTEDNYLRRQCQERIEIGGFQIGQRSLRPLDDLIRGQNDAIGNYPAAHTNLSRRAGLDEILIASRFEVELHK